VLTTLSNITVLDLARNSKSKIMPWFAWAILPASVLVRTLPFPMHQCRRWRNSPNSICIQPNSPMLPCLSSPNWPTSHLTANSRITIQCQTSPTHSMPTRMWITDATVSLLTNVETLNISGERTVMVLMRLLFLMLGFRCWLIWPRCIFTIMIRWRRRRCLGTQFLKVSFLPLNHLE